LPIGRFVLDSGPAEGAQVATRPARGMAHRWKRRPITTAWPSAAGEGREWRPAASRIPPREGMETWRVAHTLAGAKGDNAGMPLYREEGVVLRTHKLGEADRIVTILTRTRGKVRAVAKGVRRTKSRFG